MKWTVGTKIGAGFSLVSGILVIVGMAAYHATNKLTDTTAWVTHTHQVLENLDGFMQYLTDAECGQRGYAITDNTACLQVYARGAGGAMQFLADVGQLTTDSPQELRRLDLLEPVATQRFAYLASLVDLQKTRGAEAARQAMLNGDSIKTLEEIRGIVLDMQNEELALLKVRTDEAQATVVNTHWIILGCTFAALLVSCLAGYFVARSIAGPLKQITSAAEQMAAGDLSVKITALGRKDEVGALSRTFQTMTQSLQEMAATAGQIANGNLRVRLSPKSDRDTLGNAFAVMVGNLQKMTTQIGEGINVLTSSASQISTSTTQLAASAVETATAVSQATTTVEEVRQAAQVSSQKAKAVSENARNMAQVSEEGTKSTESTITGITRIRQQMESIAENTVRLSEQTQTIAQIVATVEDLAT
ncbi:MAG TPA: CHASE3 domain-containing protein, partial [Tepidisphaeraceae bacterium]|nr:CHASE3 domain-containing protein [Tepidisphaeraceae bacterium]